jgi:hypothetical protein
MAWIYPATGHPIPGVGSLLAANPLAEHALVNRAR